MIFGYMVKFFDDAVRKANGRNSSGVWSSVIWRRLVAMVLALAYLHFPAALHADERIWQDPATGWAIGGYDVVSYWSASGPVAGLPDYEVFIDGVTWRFANRGNCEEFLKHRSIYSPRYSGYGAYAISQGKVPRGNPRVWTVYEKKLYFFFSARSKRNWELARERYIRKADENWKTLQRQIDRLG